MILTFVSQKGGVGKSTLAMQVAYEWTARGLSVALIDADPQQTCVVAGQTSAERELSSPTVVAMRGPLHHPNQVPKLAKNYDHVVIDTPAGVGDVPRSALLVANVAIVPVTPGLARWSVSRTIEIIKDTQNAKRPDLVGALISTCADPRNGLGRDARETLAAEPLGLPVMKSQTFDRVAWVEATLAGQPLSQYPGGSNSAEELSSLIAEIERMAKKGRA